MKMGLIVQKFGGTSVADTERLRNVARIITDTYKAGNQVVVVLSAQGDTTDDLIEKAKEINPEGSNREMDMLLSTGEQISVALCAMAIEALGYPVVSLTGWQAGILTDTALLRVVFVGKHVGIQFHAERHAVRKAEIDAQPQASGH